MISPSLELQGAVLRVLTEDAGVVSFVGERIYDRVPAAAEFPYVSFGPEQAVSDDAECLTGFEVTLQIDVWSRAVGFPEVKAAANAVFRALHDVELSLETNALLSIQHRQTRYLRDPDGLTNHAAMEFTALVEQP